MQPSSTQANQGVFTFDRTLIGLSDFQTIFTIPVGVPARVESVYLVADMGGLKIAAEAVVLQLVAPGEAIVWAQSTPIMDADGTLESTTAVCTWGRGGNDTAQLPAFAPAAIEGPAPIYNTMPMFDAVLPALTTVGIALYEDNDGGTGTMTLSGLTVTYTPAGTGTANTIPVTAVLPMLQPAVG